MTSTISVIYDNTVPLSWLWSLSPSNILINLQGLLQQDVFYSGPGPLPCESSTILHLYQCLGPSPFSLHSLCPCPLPLWILIHPTPTPLPYVFIDLQGLLHPPDALLPERLQPEDDGVLKPALVIPRYHLEYIPVVVDRIYYIILNTKEQNSVGNSWYFQV